MPALFSFSLTTCEANSLVLAKNLKASVELLPLPTPLAIMLCVDVSSKSMSNIFLGIGFHKC